MDFWDCRCYLFRFQGVFSALYSAWQCVLRWGPTVVIYNAGWWDLFWFSILAWSSTFIDSATSIWWALCQHASAPFWLVVLLTDFSIAPSRLLLTSYDAFSFFGKLPSYLRKFECWTIFLIQTYNYECFWPPLLFRYASGCSVIYCGRHPFQDILFAAVTYFFWWALIFSFWLSEVGVYFC